jgi:putative FmdB family regulatory protein
MPLYSYHCEVCSSTVIRLRPMSKRNAPQLCKCGKGMRRLIDKPGGLVRGDSAASDSDSPAPERRPGQQVYIRNAYMENNDGAAIGIDGAAIGIDHTGNLNVDIDGMVSKGNAAAIRRSERSDSTRLRIRNAYHDGGPLTKGGEIEQGG